MHQHSPGRHELGQNFLTDRATIARIVDLARERPGPLVEWGTGNGAITLQLATLGRPLEGVEIDGKLARDLGRRVGSHVCIGEGDILRHAPPAGSVLVSNVPFHLTTPTLRHLLASTGWHSAILVTQWEVARKRAGVGGATQLTAQCWPWFDFTLDRRIPADAFKPRPSVDAGLLVVTRRPAPLVPTEKQRAYQVWVGRVFGGRGRGLADILRRNGVPARMATELATKVGRRRAPLPRDLRAEDWAAAFTACAPRQRSAPSYRDGMVSRGMNGSPS
ncbi:MAG TPA: rRNA adenine N(6)-methyltransferase family protein [Pseudonocardiaceae bacterium]|jgi:23S rRNA (adenine-N6)-dimethyltransferase